MSQLISGPESPRELTDDDRRAIALMKITQTLRHFPPGSAEYLAAALDQHYRERYAASPVVLRLAK